MSLDSVQIVRLDADYEFKPFDCGDKDLNEFLLNDSKDYLAKRIAVTYIVESLDQTIAYFSLSNDKISLLESDKTSWRKIKNTFKHRKHRRDYPAVKIGRFAVDIKYQRSFMGSSLIAYIKQMFLRKNRTGCAFITVDALKGAIPFYIKNDFKFLGDPIRNFDSSTLQLYFDLNSLTI